MPEHLPETSRIRVLVLDDASGLAARWADTLVPRDLLRVVRDPADVHAALARHDFDVVVCARGELEPLTSSAGRGQARLILDGIAEAVCSVDRDGHIVWTNAAMQTYPAEVTEAIRAECAGMLAEMAEDPLLRTRNRTLSVGGQYAFELTASALPDTTGTLDRVVALAVNTTALSRMRERLDAIDAAGRELVALEADAGSRLEVHERLRLLEDNVIRYCRDLLDFSHIQVMVLDPKTQRLETVLAGGFPEGAFDRPTYAREAGHGINGYVAATGRSYICLDAQSDPLYISGIESARSSLTVPLRLHEQIVGVLNVESDEPAAFTDEDRQVAEIFARYIATALQILKLVVVQRSEATDQVTSDVRAEMSRPLNDIVAEATHLLEDAPPPDVSRRRLLAIIEKVDEVRRALRTPAEQPAIRGFSTTAATTTHPLLEGRRVLVADDEDIIRESIADILMRAGALPVMAQDGNEAVAMLRAQRFDLVLSDIKMPYRTGYEVFAAAKEANPRCPVILITGFGYDPEHSIVRASKVGLAGVLFKPFRVEQLMELVEKALAPQSG